MVVSVGANEPRSAHLRGRRPALRRGPGRARDRHGRATTKEARLEAADGEVLAGTATELAPAVEQVLGLAFDHFTRCVVLPQGEFARFLHDKPADRQDLLERLARPRRLRAGGPGGQPPCRRGRGGGAPGRPAARRAPGATPEAVAAGRERVAQLAAAARRARRGRAAPRHPRGGPDEGPAGGGPPAPARRRTLRRRGAVGRAVARRRARRGAASRGGGRRRAGRGHGRGRAGRGAGRRGLPALDALRAAAAAHHELVDAGAGRGARRATRQRGGRGGGGVGHRRAARRSCAGRGRGRPRAGVASTSPPISSPSDWPSATCARCAGTRSSRRWPSPRPPTWATGAPPSMPPGARSTRRVTRHRRAEVADRAGRRHRRAAASPAGGARAPTGRPSRPGTRSRRSSPRPSRRTRPRPRPARRSGRAPAPRPHAAPTPTSSGVAPRRSAPATTPSATPWPRWPRRHRATTCSSAWAELERWAARAARPSRWSRSPRPRRWPRRSPPPDRRCSTAWSRRSAEPGPRTRRCRGAAPGRGVGGGDGDRAGRALERDVELAARLTAEREAAGEERVVAAELGRLLSARGFERWLVAEALHRLAEGALGHAARPQRRAVLARHRCRRRVRGRRPRQRRRAPPGADPVGRRDVPGLAGLRPGAG